MRTEFVGYYAPTQEEYERLWQEGLIVLDTNVLLDLYRLPASARDELIAVLDLLKDRLWIPYQVALEFQRRRLSVIAAERQATEGALSEANELFESLNDRVVSLQIDKRGLGLDSRPLVEGLKAANDKLIEAIRSVHQAQLDIAVSDPVRDKLDALLAGRLGSPPSDQAALDSLSADGQNRYDNKIPPGFADADKEKNPSEAIFYHDGLVYQRKFGDLILWRQLIRHAHEDARKVVLFVTSDRKEDWWWRERGKTIGPRPELAREIGREAGVELFWMYSSVQFLENAKKFTQAQVSDASVTELKEVARHRPLAAMEFRSGRSAADMTRVAATPQSSFALAESAVQNWLSRRFGDVEVNRGFPDFLLDSEVGLHGYEVKIVRSMSQMLLSPGVINAMLRGYLEVNEGRIARFSIILVTGADELDKILTPDRREWVSTRLRNLLERYPTYEILVGYVDEEGVFVPVLNERLRGWADTPEDY